MRRILHMALAVSLASAFSINAFAGDGNTEEIKYRTDPNSVKLDKKVEPVANDELMITLEGFVTGESRIDVDQVYTPVDISLVLDLSGSMGGPISSTERYPHPNAEVGYNSTRVSPYTGFDGYWSTAPHPFYCSLSAITSSQRSEYYYKHTDGQYYQIGHGTASSTTSKAKDIPNFPEGGNIYYIFIQGNESITNPFTGATRKARHFLGYDAETGQYTAKMFGGTDFPIILKEGGNPADPADYILAEGFYSTDSKETIFQGTLYTSSRLDALRNAVKAFLDVVKQDDIANLSDETGHHRVGIAKFASSVQAPAGTDDFLRKDGTISGSGGQSKWINYSQTVMPMTSADTAPEVASPILDKFQAAGATRTDLGLEEALNMLTADSGETTGRKKVAVLFTDGEPSSGSGFTMEVANDAIDCAKQLKDAGVTVYVVGLTAEASDNAITFMESVSSDFPDAVSMSNPGSGRQADKYFSLATTGEQLKSIFEAIANQTAQTEIGYELTESGSVVLDAITKDFSLPADVNPSNVSRIKVYTQEFTGLISGEYTFDEETNTELTEADGISVSIGGDTGKQIFVSGFNFAENWCGTQTYVYSDHSETDYHGKKLIITIPITINPESEGGAEMPTNEIISGIYNAKEDGTPDMEKAVTEFPVPTVNYTNLLIVKHGMRDGERALFRIARMKYGNNEEEDPYFEPITVSVVSHGGKGQAKVALMLERWYKVEELTAWSWAYTPQGDSVISKLAPASKTKTENTTVFEFNNSLNESGRSIKHAESSAVNRFDEK